MLLPSVQVVVRMIGQIEPEEPEAIAPTSWSTSTWKDRLTRMILSGALYLFCRWESSSQHHATLNKVMRAWILPYSSAPQKIQDIHQKRQTREILENGAARWCVRVLYFYSIRWTTNLPLRFAQFCRPASSYSSNCSYSLTTHFTLLSSLQPSPSF